MARLFEYQSKALLQKAGIPIQRGKVCSTLAEVKAFCDELKRPVVIKAQVWFTGRAAVGGIQFADTPQEAEQKAEAILNKTVRNFTITKVLVAEKVSIKTELFASVIIDDVARAPVLIFCGRGGSGIEEIAKEHPEAVVKKVINIQTGLYEFEAMNIIRKFRFSGKVLPQLSGVLVNLVKTAFTNEARSVEINPLVITDDDSVVAVDARITVDDYAVFRHPELGITYARELDNPPSPLDMLAYTIEKDDYRGTFYFFQLERGYPKGAGYVGFHGAGGGGSMMSMDALQRRGYKPANFCDTSGNPPASKVYRAARIILTQKNIDGYFGSGSGVASQEQVHSARGLVKAFLEENLSVPAVIRLGGNMEEKAVEILQNYTKELFVPVEGYTKDDSADFCAERFDTLVKEFSSLKTGAKPPIGLSKVDYSFKTITGEVQFQYDLCAQCTSKICIASCSPQILKLNGDKPVLAISEDDAKKGKCIECLACELECRMQGKQGCYVYLPIENLASVSAESQ
jgi:succinyl-CoA synthetase beta subunit